MRALGQGKKGSVLSLVKKQKKVKLLVREKRIVKVLAREKKIVKLLEELERADILRTSFYQNEDTYSS